MKQILLDTNAYAAFKRGDQDAIEIIRFAETIGLSTIVLGELLSGFSAGQRETKNRSELAAFLESSRVVIIPVDDKTAEYYAHIYLSLRRKGKPIPTNDLWIAAAALQHGLTVFTYDNHFFDIDGILVGNTLGSLLP
ncbi:MAG TPA: type II toxin-antitoxin system VapC family toxin [Gammaproteobacteria bacterium]|nr:type II toxin-antitoxin system VapC family toxin [Gammaproteobacteria bacterium]